MPVLKPGNGCASSLQLHCVLKFLSDVNIALGMGNHPNPAYKMLCSRLNTLSFGDQYLLLLPKCGPYLPAAYTVDPPRRFNPSPSPCLPCHTLAPPLPQFFFLHFTKSHFKKDIQALLCPVVSQTIEHRTFSGLHCLPLLGA